MAMRDHHWHFIIVLKGTFHTKLKKYKIDHRPLPLDLNIKQNKRKPVTQLGEREISSFSSSIDIEGKICKNLKYVQKCRRDRFGGFRAWQKVFGKLIEIYKTNMGQQNCVVPMEFLRSWSLHKRKDWRTDRPTVRRTEGNANMTRPLYGQSYIDSTIDPD